MRRIARVTLTDQRKEAKNLPTGLGSARWYQSLLRGVVGCVNPFHPVPLSVVYVDPEVIRDLNRRYRSIARVTDVLSFAYTGEKEELLEGEIVICPTQAQQQRHRFKTTQQQEFARLFFHGLLHIYGYDHVTTTQRRTMRLLETRLMKTLSL